MNKIYNSIITDNSYTLKLIDIDQEERKIAYLGYPLVLTKREYDIFLLLFDADKPMRPNEIITALNSKKPIDENNIAVHIHHINRKAKMIGNRNIIYERRYKGYYLCDRP